MRWRSDGPILLRPRTIITGIRYEDTANIVYLYMRRGKKNSKYRSYLPDNSLLYFFTLHPFLSLWLCSRASISLSRSPARGGGNTVGFCNSAKYVGRIKVSHVWLACQRACVSPRCEERSPRGSRDLSSATLDGAEPAPGTESSRRLSIFPSVPVGDAGGASPRESAPFAFPAIAN